MSNLVRAGRLPRTARAAAPARPPSELRRTIGLLWRYAAGQHRVFILGGIMLLIESLTAVLPALITGYLVTYITLRLAQLGGQLAAPPPSSLQAVGLPTIFSPDIDTVAVVVIGLILLAMINSLADSLAEIYLARGGRTLGFNLRVALYSHLQRLSLAFYNRQRTGDLLTRVTGDVLALEDFVTASLSDIASSVLVIIWSLIVMINTSWQVAIIAAFVIPIMALISNYFSQRIKAASKKQRAREGELAAAAQQMLTSIRVIQTYGRSGNEEKRFAQQSRQTMEAALEAAGLQARFSWVVSVLESAASGAVIGLTVWLILPPQSAVDAGLLVTFTKLMADMFKPTKKIIKEWNTFGKIYASVERVGELLDRKPAVQDAPNAVETPPLRGDIEFRHVGFAYQPEPEDLKPGAAPPPLRMTLKDVNFHVPPGAVVALVGPTGAGKSTILQLLPRLYDPHTGQVLIDGRDSREFTMDSLRGQMSMVLQESILFTGTIADNIAYGRTGATREEIIAAAIQANAHEFIEKLPEGYDTLLGERAGNLSGGQRQRLAIARAFIRNTPILILDEPTTGLDAESTDLVLLALRTLMKGKTTIIISHDLNLIRHVDQILVLKDGEIVQTGTHKELLKAGGLYADLYNKQFGRAAEEQGTPLIKPDKIPEPEFEPEPEVVTAQAFQTLLMQALPLPVTSQAFETLATQKPRPAQNGASTERPAGGIATPAPPAAPRAPVPPLPPEPGRAPIFQTTMMRVLPRRGPQDGNNQADVVLKEARMSDQASIAAPASPPAEKTDGHAYIPAVPSPAATARPEGGTAAAVEAAGPPAAPARRDPQSIAEVGGAPVDPLQSPLLRQELPGLVEAFDGAAMRERLQTALFGKTNPNYTIERATPGQAIYQPGDSCVLRYSLEVRDSRSGEIFKPLVVARVFPTQAASTVYKRDRLDPLRALMRGREEIAPFAQPVALIRPLNMVVHVFPIDGQLPTLIGATDRERVVEILRETLPDALMGDFEVEDCRIEPGHYGRMHRCVFRYYVHGRRAGSDEPETQLVYGKVADDGSGALTGPVIAALRERVLDSSSPYHFNIPHALGFRPDLQLLLLEAIPGAPQVAPLLAARLRGEDARVGSTTLEDMHEACARIAVALHTSGIKLGRRRTFDDEMTVLRDGFAAMRGVSPELAAQLQGWLERLAVVAEQSDAMPLCFSHGDFTYTQLIFDGQSSGLVDFDTVCQAEPAIDLGQFLAYLRVAVQKAHRNAAQAPTGLADELGEAFYDAYVAAADTWLADEEQLRARTSVYEIVSLLRLALHSWQKLKAARIQNVLAVLEERMACLQ